MGSVGLRFRHEQRPPRQPPLLRTPHTPASVAAPSPTTVMADGPPLLGTGAIPLPLWGPRPTAAALAAAPPPDWAPRYVVAIDVGNKNAGYVFFEIPAGGHGHPAWGTRSVRPTPERLRALITHDDLRARKPTTEPRRPVAAEEARVPLLVAVETDAALVERLGPVVGAGAGAGGAAGGAPLSPRSRAAARDIRLCGDANAVYKNARQRDRCVGARARGPGTVPVPGCASV
jgi:hypothetical protein